MDRGLGGDRAFLPARSFLTKKMPVLLSLFVLAGSILFLPARVFAGADEVMQALADKSDCQYEDLLLSENFLPGESVSDWIAITTACSGRPVKGEEYLKGLESYVSEKYAQEGGLDRVKATEWHRISLAILALGGNPREFAQDEKGDPLDLIDDGVYNWRTTDSLSTQGLNALIFALITLDSVGYEDPDDAKYKREDIIGEILEAQGQDGSFGLSAGSSSVDITAMALQALAPYREENEAVAKSVDDALTWLSKVQGQDGDFKSGEDENSESTAQTIIALCSLGIDPNRDERFSKNGSTVMDGLLKYKTSSGMFSHILGEEGDWMASYQAALALIAEERLQEGGPRLYDLKDLPVYARANEDQEGQEKKGFKPVYAIAGVICLGFIAVLVFKRGRK